MMSRHAPVGMLLNVNDHTVDPAPLAQAVEAAGFESLRVGDHMGSHEWGSVDGGPLP